MAETTQTGYRNKNDQLVLGPTGRPGSDHGQSIYVLHCGRCGHQYGANGSDIFQRHCPNCDGGAAGDVVTAADVLDVADAAPPQDRNPPWVTDELILALDLYMTNPASPPGKTSKAVIELSSVLNRLGEALGRPHGADFRNPNGVYMKMMNFRRFDPEVQAAGKVGLSRGNKLEAVVWDEFADDRPKLAAGIRSAVVQGAAALIAYDEGAIEEAIEGRVFTRIHLARERDSALVRSKKSQVMRKLGHLKCEACDFDFEATYGPRGAGYIECHHVRPVHTLSVAGEATNAGDLALVCPNCHRMIHAARPWLSVAEVRTLIEQRRAGG